MSEAAAEREAGVEAPADEVERGASAEAGEATEAAEGGEKAEGDETAEASEKAGGDKPPSKLQQLLVEYGVIAVIVLLTLSALSYVGFAVAFMVGFEVEGAGETAGAFGAAAAGWALTKPIRIPLALALTPVVAAIWHRVRGKEPKGEGKADEG